MVKDIIGWRSLRRQAYENKSYDNYGLSWDICVVLVAFEKNELGNVFWEKMGFIKREDLIYRNKNIHELKRIDT